MDENQDNIIKTRLSEFIEMSLHNSLAAHDGMKMYDMPIMGIASADDPFFQKFRELGIVGPGFVLPHEWLPGAKSVISYFLPFTKEVCDTNRAPCLDPRFKVVNRISNWSERHVAYAAGLGTFGLHRALITEKGTAGRLGSVVTTLELTPTKRIYKSYDEYCLYLTQGKCGACMRRCPPLAITDKGKDNQICEEYIGREILSRFAPRYGCAKCSISVPCESKNLAV